MDELLRAIAKEYNWPDYSRTVRQSSETAGDIEPLVGTYKNSDSTEIKIINLNNRLQLVYQHQNPLPLVLSKEKFYYTPSMNFKIFLDKNELRFEQNGPPKVFKRS